MYVNHLGKRRKVEISREEFEEATASLLGRTRTTTEIVVRQAGLRWSQIDRVILVGGSTRMPMVQRMLEETVGVELDRSVSPDEAVAHGAALYANLLANGNDAKGFKFSVSNVNSHSLGIVGVDPATGRKRNQVLIPKNTALPHTVSKVFKTHKPGQTNVIVRIVEGESERPEACAQIGLFKIEPLPANLPAGWPVQVTYAYKSNGQLVVTGQVKGQERITSTFQRETGLNAEEVGMWSEYLRAWGNG